MKTEEFEKAHEPDQSDTELLRSFERNYIKRVLIVNGLEARRLSIYLRELKQIQALPILETGFYSLQSNPANKSDIIKIVINALPEPDDSTSWEQILDYRSDPDSISKFLALRNWMNEVARAKLTQTEIEEKLEHLINQYQQHMRLHKLKTNNGMLETLVVASAQFLEDLVKLKWGNIAKGLFSIKHRQVALLGGELTSPGKEVAYIVKARQEFISSR
jgi:hypothetical protein